LTEARRGFLAEKDAIERMLAANPGDKQLPVRLADVASWRGTTAERNGEYAEALGCFAEMESRYQKLVAGEPGVVRWQLELAQSWTLTADVLVLLDRRDDARGFYAKAKAGLDRLVLKDPTNRQWSAPWFNVQLQQAWVEFRAGHAAAAAAIVAKVRMGLEQLVQTEPTSRVFSRLLVTARRLEASLDLARTDDAADAALELAEKVAAEAKENERVIGELAQCCVLAGRIAFRRGDAEEAQRHWNRGLAALSPRYETSNNWRILDPAAQMLMLCERADEARPLIERLQRFGYHPTDPSALSLLGLAALPSSTSTP
jgi:serine/threonine-protein kinase